MTTVDGATRDGGGAGRVARATTGLGLLSFSQDKTDPYKGDEGRQGGEHGRRMGPRGTG